MRRAELVATLPLKPSTGQYRSTATLGKETRYIRGSPEEGRSPTKIPHQRHDASIGDPPETPATGTCHSLDTETVASDRTGMLGSLPLYSACKPSPNG